MDTTYIPLDEGCCQGESVSEEGQHTHDNSPPAYIQSICITFMQHELYKKILLRGRLSCWCSLGG